MTIENSGNKVVEYKLSQGASTSLDLIRVIAAQMVLIGHAWSFFKLFPRMSPPTGPYIQNIGVVVFFILSGFLISYSTLRKRQRLPNYSFKDFFIERFARIYAGFLPALLFVTILDSIQLYVMHNSYPYKSAFNLQYLIGNLLMLQDFPLANLLKKIGYDLHLQISSFGSARPFWTVAVEWWMYMFFGWLLLGRKSHAKPVFLCVLLLFTIVPLWNLAGRGNGLTLVWFMGVGITGILLRYNPYKPNHQKYLVGSLIAAALAVARLATNKYEALDPLFALLLSGALLFLIIGIKNMTISTRANKIIKFMADYSFTLYLIHYTVVATMTFWLKDSSPRYLFMGAILLCNGLAAFIAYYTEMHHRSLARFIKLYIPEKI